MEYIERDRKKLKKLIRTAQLFQDDITCAVGTDFMQKVAEAENKQIFEILKWLENEPSADVVEVVRCKDCKYNAFKQPNDTIHCHRDFVCVFRKPTDFCSYGERKEQG